MPVTLSVYEMSQNVLVDVCQLKPEDAPIDDIIKQPVSSEAKRKTAYIIPNDKEGLVSPKSLQDIYIKNLNGHFGPQINFEGRKENLWEGHIEEAVVEYAAFSHKHIEPVFDSERRLIKSIIPPEGHKVEEVYDFIDRIFKKNLKQQKIGSLTL